MKFKTASGSVYEVVGTDIRQLSRGKESKTERIRSDWRTAKDVDVRIGAPAVIYWGSGMDDFSPPDAAQMGERNQRYTVTSPVEEIDLF